LDTEVPIRPVSRFLAGFPEGATLVYWPADIPEGAEQGDLDPDTSMRVTVVTDSGSKEITMPIKEVFPDASRNWQAATAK
jgi:hypothetical protein